MTVNSLCLFRLTVSVVDCCCCFSLSASLSSIWSKVYRSAATAMWEEWPCRSIKPFSKDRRGLTTPESTASRYSSSTRIPCPPYETQYHQHQHKYSIVNNGKESKKYITSTGRASLHHLFYQQLLEGQNKSCEFDNIKSSDWLTWPSASIRVLKVTRLAMPRIERNKPSP